MQGLDDPEPDSNEATKEDPDQTEAASGMRLLMSRSTETTQYSSTLTELGLARGVNKYVHAAADSDQQISKGVVWHRLTDV